jgi:hypothetical protein
VKAADVHVVRLVVETDRRTAEALALEVQARARQRGLEVRNIRVLLGEPPADEPTAAGTPSAQ